MPNAKVGAKLGVIVGVMDYSFGNFKLLATHDVTIVENALAPEAAIAARANELAVATINVENLAANDDQAKFDQLADIVIHNLKAPDLIAVEEIQDNNGATNDATVDANQTFDRLIASILAEGGVAYQYRQVNPKDDLDGGEPGGNIRVGFLFRTDRGLTFVDRPGADATTPVAVVAGGTGPELTLSPGRIDPTNAAFVNSRKPLAPNGCPRAIAPPQVLTRSAGNSNCSIDANTWIANASLISIAARSRAFSRFRPNNSFVAGTGPSPITSGGTCATAASRISSPHSNPH